MFDLEARRPLTKKKANPSEWKITLFDFTFTLNKQTKKNSLFYYLYF